MMRHKNVRELFTVQSTFGSGVGEIDFIFIITDLVYPIWIYKFIWIPSNTNYHLSYIVE